MIYSKTKLGSELDKRKQLPMENGYSADVLLSCIGKKLANFAAFGPEKCPVYLKTVMNACYSNWMQKFLVQS